MLCVSWEQQDQWKKSINLITYNQSCLDSMMRKPLIMAIQVVKFSNRGYKIRKIFFLRINITKGKFWTLRIGLTRSLSSLQKSESLSWLFHSSIIFGAKIEISGTIWVEKISSFFTSKTQLSDVIHTMK